MRLGLTCDVLVKVRLQNPEVASKYRSSIHAFTTIVREERVRGLFRGITSPLVRTLPAISVGVLTIVIDTVQLTTAPLNGVVFAAYRFFLKIQLDDPTIPPSLFQVTLAGVGCGLLASCVVVCILSLYALFTAWV